MSGFYYNYPDLSEENFNDTMKTATLQDLENLHNSSYKDLENITYYFPKKISEEVPGEQIMIMSQVEKEYYDKCLEYIFYARQIPTEDEKDMVEQICRKKSSNTPVEELTPEEELMYRKFEKRFLIRGSDSRIIFFNYKIKEIVFPEIEYDDELQCQKMMEHYFQEEVIEQIRELVKQYQDVESNDPDMSQYPFEIVVAITHLFKVQSIQYIDLIYLYCEFGISSYVYGDDVDDKIRRQYHILCDYDFEEGDINRTSYDTRYEVSYEGIQIIHLPPQKELFMIETMSYKNKFGVSLTSSDEFSFEEAPESNYIYDTFIEEYYKRFISKHFK